MKRNFIKIEFGDNDFMWDIDRACLFITEYGLSSMPDEVIKTCVADVAAALCRVDNRYLGREPKDRFDYLLKGLVVTSYEKPPEPSNRDVQLVYDLNLGTFYTQG